MFWVFVTVHTKNLLAYLPYKRMFLVRQCNKTDIEEGKADFAAWICLFYSSLFCLWTRLFCSSLYCLWTCLFYSSLSFPWTCLSMCTVPGGVWPAAACAAPGRICSTVAYAVPGGVWPAAACAASGRIFSTVACAVPGGVWHVQQLVLLLDCLSTRDYSTPGRVCLQEPIPHLDVSVYKSLFHIWTCLSTRAFVCTWGVCLQELCCTLACPSMLTNFLRTSLVCFKFLNILNQACALKNFKHTGLAC
jgi:hypothetical protein